MLTSQVERAWQLIASHTPGTAQGESGEPISTQPRRLASEAEQTSELPVSMGRIDVANTAVSEEVGRLRSLLARFMENFESSGRQGSTAPQLLGHYDVRLETSTRIGSHPRE